MLARGVAVRLERTVGGCQCVGVTSTLRRHVALATAAAFASAALVLIGVAPASAAPGIDVTSGTNTGPAASVGQIVTFSVTVTNTGDVALTDIVPTFEAGASYPNFDLAVGSASVLTGSIVVTQADLDAGQIAIDVTAANLSASDTETVVIAVTQSPALSATASVDVATVDEVGDPIVFSVLATNTGNVTLTGLVVTSGATTLSCPATTLAPGAATTCTTTYLTTGADLDARRIQPSFTASAGSPSNVAVSATASATAVTAPALLAASGATPSASLLAGGLVLLLAGAAVIAARRRRPHLT